MKNQLIIIMGVSCSGKTSVARALADQHGYLYVEADDFHSEEAIQHMSAGNPLDDTMREPWIQRITEHLRSLSGTDKTIVLSYSGLRRAHRDRFRELPFAVQFIHLKAQESLIKERMHSRDGHFMPPELLQSQFDALDPTSDESDIIEIPAAGDLSEQMSLCQRIIQN